MSHTELIDRLPFLENPAGGYTEFNPNTPNAYATYYYVTLYEHPDFEGTIPNRSATVEWLCDRAEEGFVSEGSDGPTILDLFHGTESLRRLDALDESPMDEHAREGTPALNHVREVIENPDTETGRRVGQVFRLLRIHDALDVTYDSIAPIETWLTETWREFARNVSAETLPEVERLYKSLRLIGYSHEEIAAVADPTDTIAGLVFPARLDGHPRELFALRSCHELQKRFTPSRTLSNRVLQELAAAQNDDGGFSASGVPISDCKGTYIVAKLLVETDNVSAIDEDSLRRFVSHHALDGGGFSLNYRRSPNLRPTYLVCRGLDEAHESPEELVREGTPLPQDQFNDTEPSPKELYELLYVRDLDGTDSPAIDVDRYVGERGTNLSGESSDESTPLEDAHYLTRLAEEFTSAGYRENVSDVLRTVVRRRQNRNGGFGTGGTSTARGTYYGVRTLVRRGGDAPTETATYVKANRNDDGGFGRYHVETRGSDVVSTYYSVMTLRELDVKIENPERLVSWLKDARHPNGGWTHDPRDRPGQGPTLRYTVLAEQLLEVLDDQSATAEPAPV